MSQLQDNLTEILRQKTTYLLPNNLRRGVTLLGVEGNMDADKPDQNKTCTPTTSQQVITADTGYELGSVTVSGVTSAIDPNIVAGNIKDGVSILGVTGTYEGGGSSEFMTFTSVQDMNNYATPTIGMKAIVYNVSEQPVVDINTDIIANGFKLRQDIPVTYNSRIVMPDGYIYTNGDTMPLFDIYSGTEKIAEIDNLSALQPSITQSGGHDQDITDFRRQLYYYYRDENKCFRNASSNFILFSSGSNYPVTKVICTNLGTAALRDYIIPCQFSFAGMYIYDVYYNKTTHQNSVGWVPYTCQTAEESDIVLGKTAIGANGPITGTLNLSSTNKYITLPTYYPNGVKTNITVTLHADLPNNFTFGDKRYAIFWANGEFEDPGTLCLCLFDNPDVVITDLYSGGRVSSPFRLFTYTGGKPVIENATIKNLATLGTITGSGEEWQNSTLRDIAAIGDSISWIATNAELRDYSNQVVKPAETKASTLITGNSYTNIFGESVNGTYVPPSMTQAEINTAIDTTEDILGEE